MNKRSDKMKKLFKENIFFILGLCFIFFMQLFVVAQTTVSGESMNHTLQDKDRSIILKNTNIERFDIIVFKTKELTGENKQYVKRVIGLPGETVSYKHSQLYINDVPIDEDFDIKDKKMTGDFIYQLKDDEVFVLGDNRGNSTDSRYLGGIKQSYIVGKMVYRIYPFDAIGPLN